MLRRNFLSFLYPSLFTQLMNAAKVPRTMADSSPRENLAQTGSMPFIRPSDSVRLMCSSVTIWPCLTITVPFWM